jgi:hypothetical protein
VILREDGDRVLGITQPAHSALTGLLAAAWVPVEGLPWGDLLTAAAIHDLGWTAWERAPEINPSTELPYAFYEMPDDAYREIWSRGTDDAETFGRLPGLLVSRHFTRLAGRREAMASLVARERTRQERLTGELGLGAGLLDACSDLLARWDGLSLQLCGGRDVDLDGWPFAADEFVATVDARELPAGAVTTLTLVLPRPA